MQRRVITSILLGASLLPMTLAASDAFVSTQVDVTEISWTTQVALDAGYGLQLTVSGPDNWYFRRQFAEGSSAALSPADNPAGDAPDGSYTYEVVAVQTDPASTLPRSEDAEDAATQALVTSGAFQIQGGTIIGNDSAIEEDAVRAFIGVVGNNSIDGSLCVGFDCVAVEAFGSDTLRLKENTLRIHFDDTSNSASFPLNDWRIIINDSANGGANKFAIEDSTAGQIPFTIAAGARANALYVDSQGDVGIGTATPVVEVHAVRGDTPTLRLEQDGSSGWNPQTWDVAGNETNFFIRDASNGSAIPFRIRPGAATDSLVVNSDSQVGIGVATATARLHVKVAAGEPKFRVE